MPIFASLGMPRYAWSMLELDNAMKFVGFAFCATAVAACATVAPIASNDQFFSSFRDICAVSNASSAQSGRLADALGWRRVEQSPFIMPTPLSLTLDKSELRVKSLLGATFVLVTGTGQYRVEGQSLPAEVCLMASWPAQATARAAVTDWVNIDAQFSGADWAAFTFTLSDSRRTAVAEDEVPRTVASRRPVFSLAVSTTPTDTLIDFVRMGPPHRLSVGDFRR